MKSNILLIVTLFITFLTYSQKNNGYYGKRFFLDIEGLGNFPMFSNLFSNTDNGYAANATILSPQKDNFNVGFRVNAGFAVKRNLGLSIEFGQDYSSVYGPDYEMYFDDYTYSYVKHELIDVRTTVIIPKFEFTTSKALLPMGLSHQLGFGFATSSAVEKDYMYQYTNYQFTSPIVHYDTYSNDLDPINFEKIQNVKKFVLLYALNMRTPITKSLMINYGIKYTINIGKKPNDYYYAYSGGDPTLNYTKYVENSIARHRGFSFMNAFVGLTFVF